MAVESKKVVPLAVYVDQIREEIKGFYGDDYDAAPVNTCEGGLWVSFDSLMTPPALVVAITSAHAISPLSNVTFTIRAATADLSPLNTKTFSPIEALLPVNLVSTVKDKITSTLSSFLWLVLNIPFTVLTTIRSL
jgi:hypothetical protein